MMPIGTSITPSWQLRVNISEFEIIEQSLIVTGDTHIGGVIVQLVDKLTNIRNDWSDFALWWPDKNIWLNKNKMTLDQYGVQADAVLQFTRIHKFIRLHLPDQQIVDMNVDFSQNCFYVTKQICKELGIRHSEELSLLKSLGINSEKSKKNNKHNELNRETGSISSGTSTLNNSSHNSSSSNSKTKSREQREKSLSLSGNESFGHTDLDLISLTFSPIVSTQDYLLKNTIKYKNLFDKTKVNNRWLDSSKSLMEQDVKENELVQLKFKYYAFFDLNLKHDVVRINQIYEQAKWAILTEEIDCTEQELINFAALQLQIQLQTRSVSSKSTPEFSRLSSHDSTLSKSTYNRNNSLLIEDALMGKTLNDRRKSDLLDEEEEDDIETALNKLEKSLDIVDNANVKQKTENVSSSQTNNQLEETLLLMKQQKYTFKKFRQFYFILDDNHYLSYFKSKEDSKGKPLDKINLKSCDVVPDVNLSQRKFGITLRVPSSEGMNEICIRCETEQSYANWMSAFKLASKGKPLSDMSYSIEIKSILNLLNMQQTKTIKASNTHLNSLKNSNIASSYQSISFSEFDSNEVQATNLLPARILKKFKLKQLNDRILEAYSTISDLDINESKWRYIKEWQALPTYGISYFAVKTKSSKYKEELIGVSSNRLMRISPDGETLKTWRFSSMKLWNVNWDTKQFDIVFDDGELTFICLNCDARVLHEFIGGYIYLSLRQSPKSDSSATSTGLVNEEMFFKLTEKR